MPHIDGQHGITNLQSRCSDQEIAERDGYAPALLLAIDLARQQRSLSWGTIYKATLIFGERVGNGLCNVVANLVGDSLCSRCVEALMVRANGALMATSASL
jgi:hypothetical protein